MHRLWQMDFQTRFAAGRISEIVGEKAIEVDRYQRRMGMVYGAENSLYSTSYAKKIFVKMTSEIRNAIINKNYATDNGYGEAE